MKRLTFLLLVVVMGKGTSCQTSTTDSTGAQMVTAWCNDRIFTMCEKPVDFKVGKAALEDSLTRYIARDSSPVKNGRAIFRFIVARNGRIYNVATVLNETDNEKLLINALEQSYNLWTTGYQNGYLICSFVKISMTVTDGKVSVTRLK